MKKLIIGLILSLIVFNANATDSTSIVDKVSNGAKNVVNYTDTSSLFKQVYGDMKEAIGALASSLKVGSEHVYKVLIKQQIVESITWLLIIVFLIGVPQIYRKWIFKGLSSDELSAENYVFALVFLFIFPILIGAIMFCATINNIVTGFVNPEYGAIKDIIEMVKSTKS